MGKGNAILGYARGAVGSIVFTRIKGQQIIKGRNSKPHNKRSRKQIMHRARLSTLYKFTKQMPPGLLEGAFEDQRPRENWQACFVRHNIDNAIMQMKDWVEDESKAAYGKFLMSQGSIKIELCSTSEKEASTYIGAIGLAARPIAGTITITALTQSILLSYPLQEGDILTFIVYDVGPSVSIRDPKYADAVRTPKLLCTSFQLSLTDSRKASDVLKFVEVFAYPRNDNTVVTWVGVRCEIYHQPAMAIIVSRRDGQKYLVNTSRLIWQGMDESFWQHFETEDYVRNMLRTWGMSRTAVLTGE